MIEKLSGNGLVEPSILFSLTHPCHSELFYKGLFLQQTIPGRPEVVAAWEGGGVCWGLWVGQNSSHYTLPLPPFFWQPYSNTKGRAGLGGPEGDLSDWWVLEVSCIQKGNESRAAEKSLLCSEGHLTGA